MSENGSRPMARHTTRTVGGTTVVTPTGAIDMEARLSLTAHLDRLTAGPRPDLTLDLRSVSFIDCAGLGLLCRVRNRVAARDGRLRLITDSAWFRRILGCTGLTGVFHLLPAPPEAPAARPLPAPPPAPPAQNASVPCAPRVGA
ncbi:STAS domain-containing protein [Streptomyces sp. NPDC047017]|uniref:STAS domain-containing protein n=1 Tax=Streptomyces sp. NPDC047017 TaxID=3155024 RepID=UPI0033D3F9D0